MKKFYLKSLGCKQNQLEGQIIENELIKIGYIKTDKLEDSDIYLLNSCSVTSHSDSQVNYLLHHAKKINPNIKTVLLGCVAQTYKQHNHLTQYKKIPSNIKAFLQFPRFHHYQQHQISLLKVGMYHLL